MFPSLYEALGSLDVGELPITRQFHGRGLVSKLDVPARKEI